MKEGVILPAYMTLALTFDPEVWAGVGLSMAAAVAVFALHDKLKERRDVSDNVLSLTALALENSRTSFQFIK